MSKTTNAQARSLVLRKEEFKTGNGTIIGSHDIAANTYVVYSYGTHFPMYVYDYTTEQWFGNSDRYSRTTSKHQSTCRPPDVAEWYPTHTMQQIAMFGIAGAVQHRMAA